MVIFRLLQQCRVHPETTEQIELSVEKCGEAGLGFIFVFRFASEKSKTGTFKIWSISMAPL